MMTMHDSLANYCTFSIHSSCAPFTCDYKESVAFPKLGPLKLRMRNNKGRYFSFSS